MNCKLCGGVPEGDAGVCNQCQALAESGTASSTLSASFSGPEKAPGILLSEKVPNRIWLRQTVALLCIFLALIFTALLTIRRFGISAETVGYWTGGLFFSYLISYAIAGVKRRRNLLHMSMWFLGISLLVAPHSDQETLGSKERAWQQIISSDPLDWSLVGVDKETALVMKSVFDDTQNFRQLQERQRAVLTPWYKVIYSPESFSSPREIQKVLDVLDQTRVQDSALETKLNQIPDLIRIHIEESELSSFDKRVIFRRVLGGYTKFQSNAAFLQMLDARKNWASATSDLYGYAAEHVSEILVKPGLIRIMNDETLQEFNKRITRSQKLRNDFIAAANQFEQARGNDWRSQGFVPTDFVVPPARHQ